MLTSSSRARAHSIEQQPMPAKFLSSYLAILCLLASATMWGLIWYPLRLLELVGMPGIWSTLVMYTASLLMGMVLSIGVWREFTRRPLWLLLIALTSGWTNVAFVLAVLDGNVVRVLLLFYLSPLWAVLFAYWLLQEKISPGFWGVIALAMFGALVMLWAPDLGYPWPRSGPDWLAISSGFAFALSNVFIRRVQDVSVRVKTSASWVGVVLVALIIIAAWQEPIPQVAASGWWGAIALGIGGTFVMTLAVQYGVTHMPVHRSAVILLFELVAGAVSSQLLTDEQVLPREWAGGFLIIVAAYLAARTQVNANAETTA